MKNKAPIDLSQIKDLWTGYRTAFRGEGHLRTPEIQAWLAVGLIVPDKSGENTQNKWIQGGSKRVICLPRKNLGHDEAMQEGKE
jgi:hypothetical protein